MELHDLFVRNAKFHMSGRKPSSEVSDLMREKAIVIYGCNFFLHIQKQFVVLKKMFLGLQTVIFIFQRPLRRIYFLLPLRRLPNVFWLYGWDKRFWEIWVEVNFFLKLGTVFCICSFVLIQKFWEFCRLCWHFFKNFVKQ